MISSKLNLNDLPRRPFYFVLRDKDGYYLHFVPECGGYLAGRLYEEGCLHFDSELTALIFATGYAQVRGLDSASIYKPYLIESIESIN